jgi:hypothetical protein
MLHQLPRDYEVKAPYYIQHKKAKSLKLDLRQLLESRRLKKNDELK